MSDTTSEDYTYSMLDVFGFRHEIIDKLTHGLCRDCVMDTVEDIREKIKPGAPGGYLALYIKAMEEIDSRPHTLTQFASEFGQLSDLIEDVMRHYHVQHCPIKRNREEGK